MTFKRLSPHSLFCTAFALSLFMSTFAAAETLVVYCGRAQALVEPLLKKQTWPDGIKIVIKYGDTTALAATILEEGKNSPADLFFAQDAGALGALSSRKFLAPLPEDLLHQVETRFRSSEGNWIGISGRARAVVYNTVKLKPEELPQTLDGFTDIKWKGRLGWSPLNASFQAMITAMRQLKGEEQTKIWLLKIKANAPREYPKNTPIVEAVGRGEIEAGLVNHYYLYPFLARDPKFPARNHFMAAEDAGAIVNVAGIGILASSKKQAVALQFIRALLTQEVQQYFASETFEYPMLGSTALHPQLPLLRALKSPTLELNRLSDLEGTLKLLRETGILPE